MVREDKRKKVRRSSDPFSWKRRWCHDTEVDPGRVSSVADEYKRSLVHKTEREAVRFWLNELESRHFRDLSDDDPNEIEPGTGFYMINRDRQLIAGIAGSVSLGEGINGVATHLDSPRLDLKPLPLDGDGETGLGLMRTHYYGGIKKYHWVNIPLALHGRVVREDGGVVDLRIGEVSGDPVFIIPDLLPHLYGKTQAKRKLSEGIKGEELVALYASGGVDEEGEGKPVIDAVLEILNARYGIIEEDLISSDLCLVPAFGPRDAGLGGSLIAAYGQDNRSSVFASMRSLLELYDSGETPRRWPVVFNFDREEVGSAGNTGASSGFMEIGMYKMMEASGITGTRRELNDVMSGSFVITLDVKAARNPTYKGVQDHNNSARLGGGITLTKYTGTKGKAGANDASAETVGEIRKLYNENGIVWQMQETGRVDLGGGGTVAKFLASRNMDVMDNGIPLLSMHSPYEVSSKTDMEMAVRAMRCFLERFRT